MNGWFLRTASLLIVVSLLGACTTQTVRDDETSGGATGQLGSPLVGPSPADVYIDLSGAYLQDGNVTEAFKNARKAVIVDPSSSNAYLMQALVYRRLGEEAEAQQSFRQAIKLDPRNPGRAQRLRYLSVRPRGVRRGGWLLPSGAVESAVQHAVVGAAQRGMVSRAVR
jgi:type IV pilus assembly protein PilF